jgi:hypothetical protein
MGSISPGLTNPASDAGNTESPPRASECTRVAERRLPMPRETLSTLPELEDDFKPHDTIPAPPWLGDDLLPALKP